MINWNNLADILTRYRPRIRVKALSSESLSDWSLDRPLPLDVEWLEIDLYHPQAPELLRELDNLSIPYTLSPDQSVALIYGQP